MSDITIERNYCTHPIPGQLSFGNRMPGEVNVFEDLDPWERCGCGACQATMAVLYQEDDE